MRWEANLTKKRMEKKDTITVMLIYTFVNKSTFLWTWFIWSLPTPSITFSVTRSSLFADRCLLHVGLKIIFWQWLGTITGQRNFCSVKSCFLTGQNFKKSEPILVMSNFVFVNVIVLLQGDKMQEKCKIYRWRAACLKERVCVTGW